MHLKPIRVYCSLKYHFYLEKTIAFTQFYLNMSEQMGLFQNIASKLVTRKENKTILRSWTEALLNRPKSMKFLHVHKLKFWITFYVWKCFHAYKICIEIILRKGNYNKLQHNILRQSHSQVAALLGTVVIFSYIWHVCF